MTTANITQEQIEELIQLFRQTKIAIALDGEITCLGNGVNAFEADMVLSHVFSILELPEPEVTDDQILAVENGIVESEDDVQDEDPEELDGNISFGFGSDDEDDYN